MRDKEWDDQRTRAARLGLLLERELGRSARDIKKRLAEENLQLAVDQKAFQDHLDREVTGIFSHKHITTDQGHRRYVPEHILTSMCTYGIKRLFDKHVIFPEVLLLYCQKE